MSDVDVRLENVGKQYRLGVRRGSGAFWALKDVDLEIARGASFGIIGRNGAGKSTLLKLLAGITAPTCGRIVVAGRLAALIEVGSGFHPELTGRENVFLSGAILGMRRRELAAKLSSIVEFAGVERFIDVPVKWYSSGMYVRLGFAVAAHLEPDILLIDEVLAVGDAEFQARCLTRIHDLRRQGATIVFISHDLTAIEQLCSAAALIEKGRIVAVGGPDAVIADYHRQITRAETQTGDFDAIAREGALKITNLTLRDDSGNGPAPFRTGGPLVVSIRFAATRTVDDVVFELTYYSSDGRTMIARADTRDQPAPLGVSPPGGAVEFTCPTLPLKPGVYYIGAVARVGATGHVIDWWDGGTMLAVERGAGRDGELYIPHTWRLVHDEPAMALR
jgi:ABC-type polysaccharide/polyol phosphate transport system ATPase subunit